MTRHVVALRLLSMVIPLAAGYLIGSTRLGCWHKYDCAILNSDCELIDEGFGQKMGIINKGTVLFYPNITDMGVTDPGDNALFKVYVHLPVALYREMTFLGPSSPRYSANGPRVCPILGLKRASEGERLEGTAKDPQRDSSDRPPTERQPLPPHPINPPADGKR